MPIKTVRTPKVKRPVNHEPLSLREAKLYLSLVRALLALRLPDVVLGTILNNVEVSRRIPEEPEVLHVLCMVVLEHGRSEMLARCVVACDEAIAGARAIRPEDIRHPELITEHPEPTIVRIDTSFCAHPERN